MSTGLSKEEQLRGGSDQAHRRAERTSRRTRPGERGAPTEQGALSVVGFDWETATVEARTEAIRLGAKYGGRWHATVVAVAEILYTNGVINTREVTGKSALAVVRLAQAWIEDADRRA